MTCTSPRHILESHTKVCRYGLYLNGCWDYFYRTRATRDPAIKLVSKKWIVRYVAREPAIRLVSKKWIVRDVTRDPRQINREITRKECVVLPDTNSRDRQCKGKTDRQRQNSQSRERVEHHKDVKLAKPSTKEALCSSTRGRWWNNTRQGIKDTCLQRKDMKLMEKTQPHQWKKNTLTAESC